MIAAMAVSVFEFQRIFEALLVPRASVITTKKIVMPNSKLGSVESMANKSLSANVIFGGRQLAEWRGVLKDTTVLQLQGTDFRKLEAEIRDCKADWDMVEMVIILVDVDWLPHKSITTELVATLAYKLLEAVHSKKASPKICLSTIPAGPTSGKRVLVWNTFVSCLADADFIDLASEAKKLSNPFKKSSHLMHECSFTAALIAAVAKVGIQRTQLKRKAEKLANKVADALHEITVSDTTIDTAPTAKRPLTATATNTDENLAPAVLDQAGVITANPSKAPLSEANIRPARRTNVPKKSAKKQDTAKIPTANE